MSVSKNIFTLFMIVSHALAAAPPATADDQFDILPFALPNTPPNEVWFEEQRDISRIVVEFDGNIPDNLNQTSKVSYQYQERGWPHVRIEEVAKGHPGGFGWVHQPDWFNGSWRPTAVRTDSTDGKRTVILFQDAKAEFDDKDLENNVFTYRRTYAVRVEAPNNPRIVGIYTTTVPATTDLEIELDAGADTPGAAIKLSGYNAQIVSITEPSGVSVEGATVRFGAERPRRFRCSVRHMTPSHPYTGDDAHVMFTLDNDAFTISLPSLEQQGPIWFPDMGVFIKLAGDLTPFERYRIGCEQRKTIAQQVLERPEQSLAGAHNGQPRPHLCNYNLGCTHACQRFWLENNGDVVLHGRNVKWLPGKGANRFMNKGDNARFYFGLENWRITARYPDPEPVMAYNILAQRDGISLEQKSFAVPLLTPIDTGAWQGDDPMAAMIRFRFRNDGPRTAVAVLPIRYSQDAGRNGGSHGDGIPRGPLDKLTVTALNILSPWKDSWVTRCQLDTEMSIKEWGNEAVLLKELRPGESCEAVIKLPYLVPEGQEDQALLKLSFDSCYPKVTDYWQRTATRGAFLQTPEPQLAALHTSHLAHVLLSDYQMPDGLVNTSVGTSTYGNYSNESCMIVNELDQRGLHDEAQRRLDLWIKYQGAAKQPGNFTDYDGMYFGAGGYESGSYNQHHGWVLWCLAEHFLITHDTEWFNRSADSIIAGADWIFRQRKNTMTDLPHSRGWERGFLPAGSLEDVTDFYYWLSTNSLTWRGAEYAARALEAAQHPQAARVRQEADAYKQDLIRGFETMRQHTPLVRLRDGRWVPDYPSRLYRRGREIGWIREVLEGSVYLLISGLYDANSKQAQWILDDFQDNRYMNPPYGYSVPDFEMTWYDRGGISMQPNLLAGLMPYLMRDEPEMYIWMFYNAWNSCYIQEANAMVEHPLPVLGWSNHVLVKTSDEANAVTWLRYMFVYPRENTLHLGKAIPRAWFAQSEPFQAKNVATPFGNISVLYEPNPQANSCKATVTFDPVQPPKQLLLRFRTPNKTPLKTVKINGAPATPANPDRGDVDITASRGTTTIEVDF